MPKRWQQLQVLAGNELRHLTQFHTSDRRWQMPFAAALALGLPMLIGAYFNRLDYGLVSSLGGLVFLYMPNTPLHHRMVSLMACAFGMAACYALGLMSHLFPPLMMPMLVFIATLVTMICRFYGLGPPGSQFFVMTASIGAYSSVEALQLPLMVGLLTMGCLLAGLIGLGYSLCMLRLQAPKPVPALPRPTFDFVVFDSVVIGVFVGIALATAQLLKLEKAYWVPVSCLAVIQGASLRAVWVKQLHRVIGTGIGLFAAWGLLLLPQDKWSISFTLMALAFVIELLVVRQYAIATIFITPLTILLAEATTLGQGTPSALIHARFIDTVLGCFVGLVGGICLHNPGVRSVMGKPIRRLIPD